jgi:hypothetical protein
MSDPVKNSERLILVTGATGRQGGAVYQHLQKKGFKLRALVRDPDSNQARRLTGYGESVFRGSLDDPDSLMRAMDGVYGAFSVQPYSANEIQQEWRSSRRRSGRASAISSAVQSVQQTKRQAFLTSKAKSKWKSICDRAPCGIRSCGPSSSWRPGREGSASRSGTGSSSNR